MIFPLDLLLLRGKLAGVLWYFSVIGRHSLSGSLNGPARGQVCPAQARDRNASLKNGNGHKMNFGHCLLCARTCNRCQGEGRKTRRCPGGAHGPAQFTDPAEHPPTRTPTLYKQGEATKVSRGASLGEGWPSLEIKPPHGSRSYKSTGRCSTSNCSEVGNHVKSLNF